MTESTEDNLCFVVLALKNKKITKITLLLTEKNNTAALIGINLYRVLFLYLFIQFFESC